MQGPLQYELHTVDCVKSTNTTLKELAKSGAPEGYVLTALQQTNGRGRLNRVFFSPKGTGLYCSILLRPTVPLPPSALTCMSAVAVAETIESFGIACGIKWVNDVYVNGKKAVGILTEGAFTQEGLYAYAVVGIGVNLFLPEGGFPKQITETATSVFRTKQDEAVRKSFLKKLLQRFKSHYELLPETPFLQAYRERQLLIGQPVLFSGPDGMKRGTATGIDDQFRLLVRTSTGAEYAVDRGDVTIV